MKAKLVNRDLIKSRALTKAIVLLLLKERSKEARMTKRFRGYLKAFANAETLS